MPQTPAEMRKMRKQLKALIDEVSCCLVSLDCVMARPSTPERGLTL